MTATQTIATELNLDLDGIAKQLRNKDDFSKVCNSFIKEDNVIEPLVFCKYLRAHGFPMVAKAICHFFIQTNPGALSRVLAA